MSILCSYACTLTSEVVNAKINKSIIPYPEKLEPFCPQCPSEAAQTPSAASHQPSSAISPVSHHHPSFIHRVTSESHCRYDIPRNLTPPVFAPRACNQEAVEHNSNTPPIPPTPRGIRRQIFPPSPYLTILPIPAILSSPSARCQNAFPRGEHGPESKHPRYWH